MTQIECPACHGAMNFPPGIRCRVRCPYCRRKFWADSERTSHSPNSSTSASAEGHRGRTSGIYELLAELGGQAANRVTTRESEEFIAKTAYACGLVPLAVWSQFRLDRAVLRSLQEGRRPRLHPGLVAWHTIRWACIYTYRAMRLLLLVWLTTAVTEQLKRETLA